MTEYIEREAVLKNLNRNSITKKITLSDGESIYNTIEKIPTADVVKVVRCKECEYLMFSDCYGECSKCYMGIVSPNDYCSRGKRRGADNG